MTDSIKKTKKTKKDKQPVTTTDPLAQKAAEPNTPDSAVPVKISTVTIHRQRIGYLGYRPDKGDYRDRRMTVSQEAPPPKGELPQSKDWIPPIRDQGNQGCHDAQTEVLTSAGWQRFSDLADSCELATVNPQTAELVYERPTRLIQFAYNGPIVAGQNGSSLDFCVTPDHQMLVRPWIERERALDQTYQMRSAEQLGWYSGLLNRVVWDGDKSAVNHDLIGDPVYVLPNGRQIPMAVWLRFLGIYLAEGTMCGYTRMRPRRLTEAFTHKIQLAASKPRERDFIGRLCSDLGVGPCVLDDRFTFESAPIYRALADEGLERVLAPQKFVPPFVFEQSAGLIREFLSGHWHGDGGTAKGDVRCHYTSSARLADDLQRLVFLSGDEAHLAIRPPRTSTMADGRVVRGRYPEHKVAVCARKNASIERRGNVRLDTYEGDMFCAEVPTHHTLVTRRNGRVLVSGNSCTGHATRSAVQYKRNANGEPNLELSPRFIYFNGRILESTTDQDAGCEIRDVVKGVAKLGVSSEKLCPYSDRVYRQRPSSKAYREGLTDQVTQYARVPQVNGEHDRNAIKQSILIGDPIVLGFTVFESFMDDVMAETGIMREPTGGMDGGHAVWACAYDDTKDFGWTMGGVLCGNSWGTDWGVAGATGQRGFFWFPWRLLVDTDFADDLWSISVVKK